MEAATKKSKNNRCNGTVGNVWLTSVAFVVFKWHCFLCVIKWINISYKNVEMDQYKCHPIYWFSVYEFSLCCSINACT